MKNLLTLFFLFTIIFQNIDALADDNETVNNTCNGELIEELNYISSTVTHTQSGTVTTAGDPVDYHYFRPSISGSVALNFSSTSRMDLDISIINCDGDEVESFFNKSSGTVTFSLSPSDTVYLKTSARSSTLNSYDITMVFTPAAKVFGCSNPKTFSVRKSIILPGDIIAIGNSNICSDHDYDGDCDDNQIRDNHQTNMIYINASSSSQIPTGDASENTSSAALTLPAGATVAWAGLYWQAELYDIKTDADYVKKERADTIKFKTPSGGYQDLVADEHYYVFLERSGRFEEHYQSFKDVTDLVTQDGNYSVANIQATTGHLAAPGAEAGWTLQIIYEYPNAEPRSIAINDGYIALYDSAGDGDDYVEDVNDHYGASCSTGASNTGVYGRSVSFPISGFLTPKAAGFKTDLSVFLTDADPGAGGSEEKLFITKKDNTPVLVDPTSNAWTYAITNKDGSDNRNRTPDYIYPISVTIKNYTLTDALDTEQSSTQVTFETGYDRLFMGVIGFATDLRKPLLCYDYSYKQNDRFFTEENNGTQDPKVSGNIFPNEPIDVRLYIQNKEASDIIAEDIVVNILDLNTSQATYVRESTRLTAANSITPVSVSDSSLTVSDSYIKDINAADLNSLEYFYTYFEIDPSSSTIDMPLNARIDYNITLPTGGTPITIPYRVYLNSDIELCTGAYSGFTPTFAAFNVAHKNTYLNSGVYNIPTQVAKKVDDFTVVSYDTTDTTTVHTEKPLSSVVSVELIDIGGYQDSTVACNDPDASISPRVWLTFDSNTSRADFNRTSINQAIADGAVSDQIASLPNPISNAEEFFGTVRENTAFRVSYNLADGNGSLIELQDAYNGAGTFIGYNVLNFTELINVNGGVCLVDVDGNTANSDLIAQFCNNAGLGAASSMTPAELAVCMECVYGYRVKYDCSRDNFAIRPEAFKITLSDNNQSTLVTDTTKVVPVNGHIAAGYDYRYDVNATSHFDELPVKGYTRNYEINSSTGLPEPDHNITYVWSPGATDVSGCNDTNSTFPTVRLLDGAAVNYQNKNKDVGHYDLQMRDASWTKVDQSALHHVAPYYSTASDCILNDDTTPSNLVSLTRSNVGCTISSEHTKTYVNPDTTATTTVTYQDYDITVHPYTFDITAMRFQKGDVNSSTDVIPSNAFVYQNSIINPGDDLNMSLRYIGRLRATGADGLSLSNFVSNCYSQDLNLDINTSALNLTNYPVYSYRLREKDQNLTLINDTIRGDNNLTDTLVGLITLPAGNFIKTMNGEAELELNINFNRAVNVPYNPIQITYDDFNVSCKALGDCQHDVDMTTNNPAGIINSNQVVTHLYGRAHIPRQRVSGNTAQVPIYYEFYCDSDAAALPSACTIGSFASLPTSGSAISPDALLSQDDVRWYIQTQHNTGIDGNVTSTQTRDINSDRVGDDNAQFSQMSVDNTTNLGTYTYRGNKGYPYKATMEIPTPDWLIYNRYDESNTVNNGGNVVNNFELEFTRSGSWAGEDSSGVQTDSNASSVTNRRIQW